jgi:hypothetical protein
MVVLIARKLRPITAAESEFDRATWIEALPNTFIVEDEAQGSGSLLLIALVVVGALVGGYMLYSTQWPPTQISASASKTDAAPLVVVLAPVPQAPATSPTVAPPATTHNSFARRIKGPLN